MAEFKPPSTLAEFLDANKTSTVNARFGNLAQGPIQVVTVSKGKYKIKEQPLPLTHPAFARVAEFAGGLGPALIIRVADSKVTGEVGLAAGGKIEKIERHIQKTPEILGLAGFTLGTLPKPINTIEGGSLRLGLKSVPIKLGSAFSGTFNFEVTDTSVAFDGNANVAVKGLANGALELKRAADGSITGKAAVALTLPKNFSGSMDVVWDGVSITGLGKVGYKGEKFSGEVTLQLMEKNQAQQLADAKKAPEGAAPKSGTAAPAKKPAKIEYVVFGEGDLAFSFTEWLNGTAHVIVDPKGNVTVIGEIKPQKEFILFEQKDYVKDLFKFEARASYGLPVVGNVFIFANVGMDLFAKLGPAKFYDIVIKGTYSTDPKVAKNFSIQGSLNISAAAGARLRAEAGAGLEILAHDIKAGAGINGTAGVKAYAEATPVIGYREKAVEGQDLKGEWFIRGDLEVAAQPFLGLSGDLFVELDAPWWSPLSDKKWTWPLFNKEWPLGGTIGMLVSVDYVFGSGQWPKFDFKPVEFNSEKFMTSMFENKAKSGAGKEVEQKGKWQEKNSAVANPPSKASQKGNASPGKPTTSQKAKSKPVASKKSGKPVDPNARTKEGKSVKQLQDETLKKPSPKALAKMPDKDKKKREGTAKKAFSLPKEGHTVTAKAKGGKLQVIIASREGEILAMLSQAKTEVQADKTRDESQRKVILSDLDGARQMVLSMHQDWNSAPNQAQDFATWAEIRLAQIVNLLTHLGADGIKAFSDFKSKPLAKRYLPPDYDVRNKLYIRGSGWAGNRASVIKNGRADVLARVTDVINNRTTNPPVADAAWNWLVKNLCVPDDASGKSPCTKQTLDMKLFNKTQYDVDHLDVLSIHWQSQGGNNTVDSDRWKMSDTTRLRYITQRDNLARKKGRYVEWVGPSFFSVYAQGGSPNARKIDGQPFLDRQGGSPI